MDNDSIRIGDAVDLQPMKILLSLFMINGEQKKCLEENQNKTFKVIGDHDGMAALDTDIFEYNGGNQSAHIINYQALRKRKTWIPLSRTLFKL